jgi:hypothetical protein
LSILKTSADSLTSHDTVPSILNRALPDRASSTGPQAKRQKAEDGTETPSSIITRLSSNAYKSLDEVLDDIDTAVSDIKDKLELPNGSSRNQYIPIPVTQSEITMKVTAFKQRAHELVIREKAAAEKKYTVTVNGATNSANYTANGSLGSNAIMRIDANSEDNKMVLTLFGNAPGPKQLFSSLQLPTKLSGDNREILPPFREAGLPNGITTTRIIPIQSTGLLDDKKKVPTLGELFPTPSSVPALLPPKPSKTATTRSSTVGWYQPTAGDSLPRSATYFKQPISSGQWLDYSNASTLQANKKKQRDRALSLSGAKAPQVDIEPAESEAAKLDALFRSAYSGFAPSKDDAAAIAPTGIMDRLWYQQVGEKSFERLVENANALEDIVSPDVVLNDTTEDLNIDELEETIQELEDDVIDPSLLPGPAVKSVEEKDVEEILEGISELLETLNSYQRIRHMSLNASSRPAGLLSAPDTTSVGTPTKPSEAEQATYEILKSQLTLMVATLPPYAVAKLDPDRLADLSISAKIEVQMTNYKGVMEEDEAVARAKAASLTASSIARTAQAAPVHRTTPNPALYGNQYAATRSGAPAAHQYYPTAQTPVRPPPNTMPRPATTVPVPYQPQRPAASAPYRPGGGYGTPNYQHQGPRPVQQQYTPANQQYLHTPSAQTYMRPPNQNYQHMPQSMPQGPMNGRYPGQPSYPHQAPAPQNGISYQYGSGATMPRQSSPQKPLYSPNPPSAQPRPSYSTPTPPVQQDRRAYGVQNALGQSPTMNGSIPHTPQPQYTPQSTGLTGYNTYMSEEQQSNMMARQRAQLAAQQSAAQEQARSAAQAAMGSPSKTQVSGGNPLAAGL